MPYDADQSVSFTFLGSELACEEAATEWRNLYERSTAPFIWFQSYDWCLNWIRTHRSLYSNVAVLCVWNGKKLRAVLPLMIQSNLIGIRVLRGLGEPHAQYTNILTETGSLSNAEVECVRHAIRSLKGVDSAEFNLVPAQSLLARCISANADIALQDNEACYLDLSEFKSVADYDKSLSKSTRRGRSRRRKMLEGLGALSYRVLRPGDQDYDKLVRRSLRFKDTWLRKTGRVGNGIKSRDHDRFLSSLPRHQDQDGPLLFCLEVAGQPVAIEIGFLSKGHFYAYLGSFNWSHYELSPGKVLMEHIVHWLIEHRASAYDLLANPTDYKNSWTNRQVALNSVASDFTLAGVLHSQLWSKRTKPLLKRGFNGLPDSLRIGLLTVRDMELKFVV